MFVKAIQKVEQFTWPLIVSTLHQSGQVKSSVGTLIVINDEGWFLTAAHMVETANLGKQHAVAIAAYQKQADLIKSSALPPKQKQKKISRLKADPDWIAKWSYWWGRDGVQVPDLQVNPLADIALGRLQPFDPAWVGVYPTFKHVAAELPAGASLCRLGFPFYEVRTALSSSGSFEIAPGSLPIPRFPNEGILTRIVIHVNQAAATSVKFIETSSPGLRGQSGGPVFDTDGNIWGLQSRTIHLPLGFSPEVKNGQGHTVVEHQFMNVGLSAHVDELVKLMTAHGARFQLSS